MPPKVNRERCIGCGTCTRTCPFNVFELKEIENGEEKSHVVRPENCEYYGACVHQCPRQTITLYYPPGMNFK